MIKHQFYQLLHTYKEMEGWWLCGRVVIVLVVNVNWFVDLRFPFGQGSAQFLLTKVANLDSRPSIGGGAWRKALASLVARCQLSTVSQSG